MKTYGLLGKQLLHSLSPEIHRELGNFRYELFQLEEDELDSFFEKREFAGLNVTTPYKERAVKYCDELSDNAKRIGCVDTITVDENGKLRGANTEYDGFLYTVQKSGIEVEGKKVVILGNGGSAHTVEAAITTLGAKEIIIASENGNVNFSNIYDLHPDANVIINTTETGMYPNNGERIINIKRFSDLCGAIDLIYNPRRTRLICDAEDMDIPNIDGLSMLVAQAYMTECKFGIIESDINLMMKTYKTMSDRRKNIMFVGMPGSGKTTNATVVAAKLARPCIDVDKIIEMKAGMPVAQIVRAYGEKYYRELETEALRKITRNGGQVISTDSGVVLSLENQYYIRQNGYVVYLHRPLDELKSNGVPLIRNREALERVLKEREPLYKFLADITVEVTDNAETTVSEVIERMGFKETPQTF
ncbi:MAG: shikimate kinase [Clostridia bacterium]|nr:shikimate kinase [Clostridia bacterium]